MNSKVKSLMKSALNRVRGNRNASGDPPHAWLRGSGVSTVLDVGAHVGTFSAEIRQLLPDAMIYAFEPQADSFDALNRRFSGDSRFLAFPIALADKNEEADFFVNNVAMASSLNELGQAMQQEYPSSTRVVRKRVQVERLDDFLNSRKISLKPEVLLKVDVQGAENRLLSGAVETLKAVQFILIEVSFVELYKDELLFEGLYDILRSHGFRFRGCEKTDLSPKTRMPIWADCIFSR